MRLWASGQLVAHTSHGAEQQQDALSSELAAFGLALEENVEPGIEEACHLWPENLLPWECWHAVQTQWRIGMGGATGLDYTAVLAYLKDGKGLPGKEWREVFGLIQLCERETLRVWAEKRERDTTK